MEIWVHRGKINPADLGNNLDSFRTVHDLGATGIETDISFTSNRKVIIYHPGSLNRNLNSFSLHEIKNMSGLPFPILTLENLLEFMLSLPDFQCLLELKQDSRELIEAVVELISKAGLEKRILLTSFQRKLLILDFETGADLLTHARTINPAIRTHIIANFPFNLTAIAEKYRPNMISLGWLPNRNDSKIFYKCVIEPFGQIRQRIAEVKSMGIKIIGGILDSHEDINHFMHLGADGIMTNDIRSALQFRA